MVYSLLALAILIAAGVGALWLAQTSRLRRLSLQRIGMQAQEPLEIARVFIPEQPDILPYPTRYPWAPPVAGLLAACAVYFLTNLPAPYMLGFAGVLAAITYLLEMYWADANVARIESQLADAIDLMVASLRAGSGLLAALETTVAEARSPLREELEIMAGRIRVGQNPALVVRELAIRVPLESFRLFAHTLLVHWETGGSLATSLRTVGRTVRDRLEVSRRISAQAVESQVSVIAILAISYGLTAFMLNTNPAPVMKLLYSRIGAYAAAAVMLLQAMGMVWIWRMSRIRF
jgi:tight adherence protein B